ncbi:MAG: 2-hydroxycarboxylate transporter family protein [Treponema sp.]|jgi:Na+/citrate or Na+/malate symporter|nr:2-hydroxycarboxylate transporter family protein [Treponema sp.]
MANSIKFEVCGLPAKYFLPFAAVILVATYTGTLNGDFVGSVPFLMAVGGIFFWLGNTIPILNNYLAGACLLPLFGASIMKYFGLIPEPVIKSVNSLMRGGYQNLYIAALLVGSILCMNRKVLLGATARYLPAVIGSQVFALIFLLLGGLITGTKLSDAVFMIGAPIMSGGSAGAITTLPATYSAISGQDMTGLAGPFLCYASIANVIAVLAAALLVGPLDKTNLSGKGAILIDKNAKKDEEETKRPGASADFAKIGAGLFMSCVFMVAGNIMAAIIPAIAGIAWAIILAIIAKCTGIISDEICDGGTWWMNFMLKNGLPMLIAGIGVSSLDITSLGAYFTVSALIIIVLGIVGGLLGAMIFGRLVGLFPFESGVTAGLCCCNIGGSGDIAVLTAANRMNLLAFASISTRIGGALMILWISLLYPFFM